MKRLLAGLATLLAAGAASADLVVERWGANDTPCTYQGTLDVLRGAKETRLVFGLSALPKGATVHHASLFCFTKGDLQPRSPATIHVEGKAGAAVPLKLEAPWFRSFDATEAVRRARDSQGNLTFAVLAFDGLVAEKSCLEIRYEGTPRKAPRQVDGLRVVHHDGQTFLVWRELEGFRPPPGSVAWVDQFSRRGNKLAKEPGAGWRGLARVPAITLKTLRELQGTELRDKPSGFQGIQEARRVRRLPEIRYRVYRHTRPITAQSIKDAELVGEGRPLSAYDQKMAVIAFRGEYIDQREVGESIIPTSCVEDGKPVNAGEAIYVHQPATAGTRYYAVTAACDGTENASDLGKGNSLAEPVAERLDPPKPVLQRLQEIDPRSKVVERWHLFWPAPPYANVPAPPLHVLVGEPGDAPPPPPAATQATMEAAGDRSLPQRQTAMARREPPLPMVIDGFHGGFNIVEALRVPSTDALTLLIEHQTDWGGDGDLLYNEGRGTLRSFEECRADYFSERCFLRMVEWAMGAWPIDRARVVGGQHDSGPLHIGVRHPEIFRRIFLGNYTASYVYAWAPPSNALPSVLGPRDLAKTPDGHAAWDVLDLGWFLRQDPGRDIPFVMVSSGTGKDSGHTSEFGWQDDPRGMAALRDARQPFLAAWSTGGDDPGGNQEVHTVQPEIRRMFDVIRWDASIPAFSHCSLDNNPGNGDPADGDSCGQMNGYLIWDNRDAVDEADAWEMTVWVVGTCPEEACTVDITPRHCRKFRLPAGQKLRWTNTSLADGRVVATGTAAVDRWRLATVPGVRVSKSRNRIRIEREGRSAQ